MFKVICHLVIIYVAPPNDYKSSIVLFLVQSMTHSLFHLSKKPSFILETQANAFREVLMGKK